MSLYKRFSPRASMTPPKLPQFLLDKILLQYLETSSTPVAISKRLQHFREKQQAASATTLQMWYRRHKFSKHTRSMCFCSHNCLVRSYVYLYEMRYFRALPELAVMKCPSLSAKTVDIYRHLNVPDRRVRSDLRRFIRSMTVSQLAVTGW